MYVGYVPWRKKSYCESTYPDLIVFGAVLPPVAIVKHHIL